MTPFRSFMNAINSANARSTGYDGRWSAFLDSLKQPNEDLLLTQAKGENALSKRDYY